MGRLRREMEFSSRGSPNLGLFSTGKYRPMVCTDSAVDPSTITADPGDCCIGTAGERRPDEFNVALTIEEHSRPRRLHVGRPRRRAASASRSMDPNIECIAATLTRETSPNSISVNLNDF